MTNTLLPQDGERFRDELLRMVTDAVDSPNTRRNYARAINEFLDWHAGQGRPALSRRLVLAYKAKLQADGLASSTINVKLSAIRKLVREAADNGLLDETLAQSIVRVPGVKMEGERLGNWLDRRTAQELVNAPDLGTVPGLRDRALLAVLVGAALRREEAAHLTVEHIQQREARWVIVDLAGKRGKVRSVPLPAWVKLAIDEWTRAAEITSGPIFLALRKGGNFYLVDGQRRAMSTPAIWKVVRKYTEQLGLENISPHDLRRTSAQLMRKGGAAIEQISLVLGHASIDVTKRYLGTQLDLQDAATDRIDIRLRG